MWYPRSYHASAAELEPHEIKSTTCSLARFCKYLLDGVETWYSLHYSRLQRTHLQHASRRQSTLRQVEIQVHTPRHIVRYMYGLWTGGGRGRVELGRREPDRASGREGREMGSAARGARGGEPRSGAF